MTLLLTSNIRKKYQGTVIAKDKSPFSLFKSWFLVAKKSSSFEPNAMVLSTLAKNNQVRSRYVLLKDVTKQGFCFFTNADSNKAKELKYNNKVSLLFYWPQIYRQVRIEGKVIKLSQNQVRNYFYSRPKDSQIASYISKQSQPLKDRETLINLFNDAQSIYIDKKVPMPNWAGYCLVPNYFEFWSGMPNRMHDRIEYKKIKNKWLTTRLYP